VVHSKGHAKGKVYSYKCLFKNKETSQINSLMMHLRKTGTNQSKTNRWSEIMKIRAEVNEIGTKKLFKESTKQNIVFLKKLIRFLINP
jgi:hypothetical protein